MLPILTCVPTPPFDKSVLVSPVLLCESSVCFLRLGLLRRALLVAFDFLLLVPLMLDSKSALLTDGVYFSPEGTAFDASPRKRAKGLRSRFFFLLRLIPRMFCAR